MRSATVITSGCLLGLVLPTTFATGALVSYDAPSLDRWMYPFNPTPGTRSASSVFGATGQPDFDNRDGQMIIGFTTAADIPPGLGSDAYTVTAVRLILETAEDETFIYDDTQDPYAGYLDEMDPDYVPDVDPGQPLELFGVGFRNGISRTTFVEEIPYAFGEPIGQRIRNAFALGNDGSGGLIDVSLSVDDRFDPFVWAIGTMDAVSPGELVPVGTEVTFDVDVTNADVQGYVRESLNDGTLLFAVTSFSLVEPMGGSSEFPVFHNRESTLVALGLASAARLELEVTFGDPCTEDIDGSGDVGFTDLLTVLSTWGPCPPEACPADLDDSGDVGFTDLLAVLAAWGPCE